MVAPQVSDPEQFWDDKVQRSGGDHLRAVCLDTPEENSCIDRVQRTLARSAMERLRRTRDLTGMAVLDYGCGTGRWVDFLRGYGCRYTGVDLSTAMLAIAQGRHPDAEFRKGDGQRIPCGDKSFDLIWSIAVVHHNPPDRQELLLAEFGRVLRDGGVLILLEGVERSQRSEAGIYYPRTRDGWSALAQRHGLSRRWRRGACYFLLRSLGEVLRRQHGVISGTVLSPPAASAVPATSPSKAAWIRWAARVDGVLCPRLAGVLPPPLHRRAIMLFEKARQRRGPNSEPILESSGR